MCLSNIKKLVLCSFHAGLKMHVIYYRCSYSLLYYFYYPLLYYFLELFYPDLYLIILFPSNYRMTMLTTKLLIPR